MAVPKYEKLQWCPTSGPLIGPRRSWTLPFLRSWVGLLEGSNVTNVATYSTVGHLAEIRMVSPEFREGSKSTWETTSPFITGVAHRESSFLH